ncbi:hypothetical protein ACFLX8_03430 [Chloroflexota bacterium]
MSRSYYIVLRESIFSFHRHNNDSVFGEQTLESKLEYFTSTSRLTAQRKDLFRGHFNWYVTEYYNSNFVNFQCQYNVRFHLLHPSLSDLELTGQICRMDINPQSGYTIWQFSNSDAERWEQDIQMPIIQQEMARTLNTVPQNVEVGIIRFPDRYMSRKKYTSAEIQAAENQIVSLLNQFSS